MGVAFNEERNAHHEPAFAGRYLRERITIERLLHDLLDHNGEGMREFIAHTLERSLAHELRDTVAHALLRELIIRVERWALGKMRGNDVHEHVDLLTLKRGDGNDVFSLDKTLNLHEVSGELVAAHEIHLRHDRHDRRAPTVATQLSKVLRDKAIARPDLLVSRKTKAHDINLGQGFAHEIVEALTKEGAGAMNARGIDDDDLVVFAADDPSNGSPRRLRFRARNRDLVPHHRIRERRFADVGPADESDEATSMHGFHFCSPNRRSRATRHRYRAGRD